ncbi:hypothetical protein WAF17_10915 [Bernardetia sp. ABR2-2B]|uniref:hypothetical protein n=1 Tax=Bernardetia sp. ABR2-2B TaxID=3127472 RepID=UPI0030D5111F
MKRIVMIFCVLLVCFGFSEKEKSRIEENCCDSEINVISCLPVKKIAPGYVFYKKEKQRVVENKTSLLLKMNVEKGVDYMLRYELQNRNGYLKHTGGLFLLNQKNDTLVETFINGKSYDGFTYKSENNETLLVYFNPHENPLLLQKHKRKDKCAKVRCIEYTIGVRMVAAKD